MVSSIAGASNRHTPESDHVKLYFNQQGKPQLLPGTEATSGAKAYCVPFASASCAN
jgi:hypothetical protein